MAGRFISTQSIVIELPMRVSHLPERGSDVFSEVSGSSVSGGFNVVSAVARQGISTALASPLGTGPNSILARAALGREGIALLVSEVVGDIGLRIIMLESDGTRTTITSPGAEAEPSGFELSHLNLAAGDWVHVSTGDLTQSFSGSVISSWIKSLDPQIKLLVSTGPTVGDVDVNLLEELMRRANVLTMNSREGALVASMSGPGEVSQVLRQFLPPTSMLVLRDGEHGCTVQENAQQQPQAVASFGTQRVDTTGVGEAHIGVMAAGIMQGINPFEAARRANAAAAVTLTREGSGGCPSSSEIDAFLLERG